MKYSYIYLVFSRDRENGQCYWAAFDNFKAAQKCVDHYNEMSINQRLGRWYFLYKEKVYSIY